MNKLQQRAKELTKKLSADDILTFPFQTKDGKQLIVIYVDGMTDKALMGDLLIKPILSFSGDFSLLPQRLALAELRKVEREKDALSGIMEGNALLMSEEGMWIVGLRNPPGRTVIEPPTQISVKGPREGFTEDMKTNVALVRKRLKTEKLQVQTMQVGKNSQTQITLIGIQGVYKKGLMEEVKARLKANQIDLIPDSSYVNKFLTARPKSLFKQCGTCEKPDIFCAKISEGRIGVLVDGSPIALTLPYMLIEDFQVAEDYYVTSYRASILRMLRFLSMLVGIFLPAIYVTAQLFKVQLIPLNFLLKIASSSAGLPVSPSVEIFLTLFVFEVLNEASIRMPNYVGLALSVVGALVLSETAVKAGIISSPAIIIVAFSAVCLYTVPDLIETSAVLRWLYLIIAGSVGPFGVVLLTAMLLCYLVSDQSFGTPLLAPFSPFIREDLKDTFIKRNLIYMGKRPRSLNTKNKTRMKESHER